MAESKKSSCCNADLIDFTCYAVAGGELIQTCKECGKEEE